MNKKTNYYFDNECFVIEDYDKQKPFASFLPAIAGKKGIPMWSYYCNRGQGLASFGLRDKDGAILEFSPANTSYRVIDKLGFRTFIKENNQVYEIFSPDNLEAKRKMYIENSSFSIEEINNYLNIKVKVTYFGLPNENIGGLVRIVTITNLLDIPRKIEVCDGVTEIIPSGVGEWSMKHQSNLIKSWMDVDVLDNKIAFYKTNSAPGDEAEVKEIHTGNYYLSCLNDDVLYPIYDSNIIFGTDTTFSKPLNFIKYSVNHLCKQVQYSANKVPVGFSMFDLELKKQAILKTLIGFTYSKEMIISKIPKLIEKGYFETKLREAKLVLDEFLNDITTKTNYPLFDAYMKQNYLDNILRGGYPMIIKAHDKDYIYHLYSRRHGDMEREYNFFSIAPEYYSQGNGNFRDVCQNRRSDNLFHKEVEIFNAKVFANLISLDGYNPLQVSGSIFRLRDKNKANNLALLFDNKQETMKKLLEGEFTPGIIMNKMENESITTKYQDDELFALIFSEADQEIKANFGEGYWSDHWTYIYDLIENALKIYPEKENDYLFKDMTYKFYVSPATVLPRSEKYVKTTTGKIRQYGALIEHDKEKIASLHLKENDSNWLTSDKGEVIYTNLFGKLLTLATLKFASLDSIGVGIEMEANKPGWNDAMNGLPGLFGSGVSETIELLRIVKFLNKVNTNGTTVVPIELNNLIRDIKLIYDKNDITDTFNIWDKVTTKKEEYRSQVRLGIKKMVCVVVSDIADFLKLMEQTLNNALIKALKIGNGVYPTFIVFEATRYEDLNHIGNYNLPTVKVKEFKYRTLPYFLEAPARSLKIVEDKKALQKMYKLLKESDIYDKRYHMYKTSVSLENENYDIGRIRAFQSGWLERESNFLHMTYKYLLGLLKAKMYKEFFSEIKTNFVCFMDPEKYGRSILENSSFIAPSNNPDPFVHGQGFVSRLSGSTAEMLSIWNTMMFGEKPFTYNDRLELSFRPVLSSDFFDNNGEVQALFLSNIMITYINKDKKNIFGLKPVKYELYSNDTMITKDEIIDEVARDVRDNKYTKIRVYF